MPVVKCPECQQPLTLAAREGSGLKLAEPVAPIPAAPTAVAEMKTGPDLHPVFRRNQFLLRQRVLTIGEKYVVWDERAQSILHIVRPTHFFGHLGAVLAGLLVIGLPPVLAAYLTRNAPGTDTSVLAAMGTFAVSLILGIFTIILLKPKRHVYFYLDEKRKELILKVFQNRKINLLTTTFTVATAEGTVLAHLSKDIRAAIIRRHWDCYKPDGQLLCTAREDELGLAILRRFMGPLFGVLRTNFIYVAADGETILGEFNRNLTILDRYSLDMARDPYGWIDRRVAVAIGVLLDTGEKR
jgi:hypothetical protein